jgi:hypothetical protein
MSSSILSGIYTLWNSDTVLITGLFLFFFSSSRLIALIFHSFSFHSLLLQNYLIPSSLNYKLADLVFNCSADMTFKSNTPRSEFGSPKIEKTKRILANHMHLNSGRVYQTSPCKIRGMCLAFSSSEDTSGPTCKHLINLICFCILKKFKFILFFILNKYIFNIFKLFWCVNIKNNFKKIKNYIILIHFQIKIILKNYHNLSLKHAIASFSDYQRHRGIHLKKGWRPI